jgi:hypothetical protein
LERTLAWERTAEFWTARDAWAAERRKIQAAAVARGSLSSSRTLEHASEKWRSHGDRYLSRYGGVRRLTGRDDARLVVDPSLDDLVRDILDAVAPKLAEGYDLYMSDVIMDAFKEWPVSTGLSKSLLYIEYDQTDDTHFVCRMGCAAPYTVFIQDGPAYKLIREPGLKAAQYVAEVFVNGEPF